MYLGLGRAGHLPTTILWVIRSAAIAAGLLFLLGFMAWAEGDAFVPDFLAAKGIHSDGLHL